MTELELLIAQARGLATGACNVGEHDWQSEGGRACPRTEAAGGDCGGSQPVLICVKCGEVDYGQRGGPADCETGACGTARPGQVHGCY